MDSKQTASFRVSASKVWEKFVRDCAQAHFPPLKQPLHKLRKSMVELSATVVLERLASAGIGSLEDAQSILSYEVPALNITSWQCVSTQASIPWIYMSALMQEIVQHSHRSNEENPVSAVAPAVAPAVVPAVDLQPVNPPKSSRFPLMGYFSSPAVTVTPPKIVIREIQVQAVGVAGRALVDYGESILRQFVTSSTCQELSKQNNARVEVWNGNAASNPGLQVFKLEFYALPSARTLDSDIQMQLQKFVHFDTKPKRQILAILETDDDFQLPPLLNKDHVLVLSIKHNLGVVHSSTMNNDSFLQLAQWILTAP